MEFVLNQYHRNISDSELLDDVKRVADKLNSSTLSAMEYKEHGKYGITTFRRRFGSWLTVLEKCNLSPNHYQVGAAQSGHAYLTVSDDALIKDIQRVAELLGVKSYSSSEYSEFGEYSRDICFRRFSTWNNALMAAGLIPFDYVPGKRISNEILFSEIERMWTSLGRQPTATDVKNGESRFSLNTYSRRFGGWRAALEAFVTWINSDSDEIDIVIKPRTANVTDNTISEKTNNPTKIKHSTSRDIGVKLRFKVMSRDHFKCCICGCSPATDPTIQLHIDHIIPWSKGGETTLDNLQTLCSKCNLGKSDS